MILEGRKSKEESTLEQIADIKDRIADLFSDYETLDEDFLQKVICLFNDYRIELSSIMNGDGSLDSDCLKSWNVPTLYNACIDSPDWLVGEEDSFYYINEAEDWITEKLKEIANDNDEPDNRQLEITIYDTGSNDNVRHYYTMKKHLVGG